MMRKAIALLLCALLLCCCALAETAEKETLGTLKVKDAFTIKGVVPEDYTVIVLDNETETRLVVQLAPKDETKPSLTLSIAYDETYSDVERMNDLSEEDIELIKGSFSEMDAVTFSDLETAYGTKLLMVQEVGEGNDFVDFYTIYKGYSVDIVLTPSPLAENPALTQEQIDLCVGFMSDMDFEPMAP